MMEENFTGGIGNKYAVKKCSWCPLDTEYYCHDCKMDICCQCKEIHLIDLDTKWHYVTIYREKMKSPPKQEPCARHPSQFYNKYCRSCRVPVCDYCSEHNPMRSPIIASVMSFTGIRIHHICSLQNAYEEKRQQHKEMVCMVRSEIMYDRLVHLKKFTIDFICDKQICQLEVKELLKKIRQQGQRMRRLIDSPFQDDKETLYFIFKKICKKNITNTTLYETCPKPPVKFLRFIRKKRIPKSHKTNMKDLIELLGKIQITKGDKRYSGKDSLLKQMSVPMLINTVEVKDVNRCFHISHVTPARVWVCDITRHFVQIDTTTGDTLHRINFNISPIRGVFTVNSEKEFIYIDPERNISKLFSDMRKRTTFIKMRDWTPLCVFSSTTGNIFVGMNKRETGLEGKVARYNKVGKLEFTIQYDNTNQFMYKEPSFITENNNGDVVVSDMELNAVVVTQHDGTHRFSYTGNLSELKPCAICTDALSNILVSDGNTYRIHIINKDGQFLKYLEIEPLRTVDERIILPRGLSYDANTHLLWVGSGYDNKLSVYRYMTRRFDLFGTNEN